MGNILKISDIDCVFISYDEPNAEKHWADLESKCFWAQRVHGVKGSDECHKAAANLAQSEWFVTVDADNIVDEKFFNVELDLDKYSGVEAFDWPGLNALNGLRYGNGSLKVWRKDFVLNMKTHEASDTDRGQVDFCWERNYKPLVKSYSTTWINGSAYQAWRAGFREGVKLSLIGGVRPEKPSAEQIHWHNLTRLKVWMTIGSHIENGLWAMLGARMGFYMTNCTDWNYIEVRDFDLLAGIFKTVEALDEEWLEKEIIKYGDKIIEEFGVFLPYSVFDYSTSKFIANLNDIQYQQIVGAIEYSTRRLSV